MPGQADVRTEASADADPMVMDVVVSHVFGLEDGVYVPKAAATVMRSAIKDKFDHYSGVEAGHRVVPLAWLSYGRADWRIDKFVRQAAKRKAAALARRTRLDGREATAALLRKWREELAILVARGTAACLLAALGETAGRAARGPETADGAGAAAVVPWLCEAA